MRPVRAASVVCERGEMCVHDTAGYALNPVRLRLALATPSGWFDALVLDTDDAGIHVSLIADGTTLTFWHHADLTLTAGEPVAVHARYGVLAARGSYVSIAA